MGKIKFRCPQQPVITACENTIEKVSTVLDLYPLTNESLETHFLDYVDGQCNSLLIVVWRMLGYESTVIFVHHCLP